MKFAYKRLLAYTLVAGLCCCLGMLTIYSTIKSSRLSEPEEIQSLNNITDRETASFTNAIKKSRNSTVNVMSMSHEGIIRSSTGTYIRLDNDYYILTVGHGIHAESGCETLRIIVDPVLYECLELSVLNNVQDYAIIKIEEISERTPVVIPRDTPRNSMWDENLSIQSRVIYSGFPNSSGLLTIDGRIVGFNDDENFFIHSYAWPGASGSGVFNENGKLIGYIMAISLGFTEYGISVLEDIVIIVPLYKIDWHELDN